MAQVKKHEEWTKKLRVTNFKICIFLISSTLFLFQNSNVMVEPINMFYLLDVYTARLRKKQCVFFNKFNNKFYISFKI